MKNNTEDERMKFRSNITILSAMFLIQFPFGLVILIFQDAPSTHIADVLLALILMLSQPVVIAVAYSGYINGKPVMTQYAFLGGAFFFVSFFV